MITIEDIETRLNVSTKQIEMAIYSGMIPTPNERGAWDENHIEPFLMWWKSKLDRSQKREPVGNYESGKLSIPRHTR